MSARARALRSRARGGASVRCILRRKRRAFNPCHPEPQQDHGQMHCALCISGRLSGCNQRIDRRRLQRRALRAQIGEYHQPRNCFTPQTSTPLVWTMLSRVARKRSLHRSLGRSRTAPLCWPGDGRHPSESQSRKSPFQARHIHNGIWRHAEQCPT